MNETYLVALFGLSMAGIFLMQLGSWKSRRDWNRLWQKLDERRERQILRDFILAFDEGNLPEAMICVYDSAVRAIERPYEHPIGGRA